MLWKHAAAREKEYMSNRSALTPDVKGLLLLHEYQETGKKFLHVDLNKGELFSFLSQALVI